MKNSINITNYICCAGKWNSIKFMRNNSNQSTNNNNNNKNNLNEEQPDRQKHCRYGHMIPHCSHNINNECFAALLLLHCVVAKKLVMRVIHKVCVCAYVANFWVKIVQYWSNKNKEINVFCKCQSVCACVCEVVTVSFSECIQTHICLFKHTYTHNYIHIGA